MSIPRMCLFVISLLVFAWGIAEVVLASKIVSTDSIYGQLFLKEHVFMLPMFDLFCGLFFLIIGLMGCCGALQVHQKLLLLYGCIVSMLLLFELFLGIYILSFTDESETYILNNMDHVFGFYGKENREDMTDLLDSLQHRELKCCGVRNYTDWANYTYGVNHPYSVPDGCCRHWFLKKDCGIRILQNVDFEKIIHTNGCFESIMKKIKEYGLTVGLVSFFMVSIQFLSILFACMLAKKKSRYQEGSQ